ncbi:MAG: KAP family NTPase [Pseudoxanthomonas sp.]|jgi:hypothetical protein|uniref:KAP family P-loop NTPase fold protein n=1 Tax=Pseudoxanthomonas TaxID=83618 RepID=UPI001389D183|nr:MULTISPECIES: P-loop NTPase fold protein [Pseudoxanthomonas]KAF1724196.1 hypothetical protein CSC76_14170 [Pseudoxanthomonas mexicana]MCH2091813.1 KAP family NTPase [Pseudoxanthomonas sp.]
MSEQVSWARDTLERKDLAQFLSVALTNLSSASTGEGKGGLTVALDAEWGAGKTFFVKEWMKDLRAASHPVVYFDAWANDLGEEASVALMAEILGGLDEWRRRLPGSKGLATSASDLTKQTVRSLRAALLPAAGVIAKGLVKKATGVVVDDVIESFGATDEEDGATSADAVVDGALDKLFEKAIEAHGTRKKAVAEFKENLTGLISLLSESAGASLPLFVFIDELDRCRPSYALKMLEEVKHIFGISGVVYVISTNIDQLQNSVRAVYGAEFDGRGYLRRMFDKEYSLPVPTADAIAMVVEDRLAALVKSDDVKGIPRAAQGKALKPWGLVARAMMPSDIRSQKQTVSLICEVYPSLEGSVHLLWLYYLASLYRTNREMLDRWVMGGVPKADIKRFVVASLKLDVEIPYMATTDRFGHDKREASTTLSEVIHEYMRMSVMENDALRQHARFDGYSYPRVLAIDVVDGQVRGDTRLASYAPLVRSAGYLTTGPH